MSEEVTQVNGAVVGEIVGPRGWGALLDVYRRAAGSRAKDDELTGRYAQVVVVGTVDLTDEAKTLLPQPLPDKCRKDEPDEFAPRVWIVRHPTQGVYLVPSTQVGGTAELTSGLKDGGNLAVSADPEFVQFIGGEGVVALRVFDALEAGDGER